MSTKIELEEKIKDKLTQVEYQESNKNFVEKFECLSEAVDYIKLYKETFGRDYKHKFAGMNIVFSEEVVNEMENMIIMAANISNEWEHI